jgi:hypothetical protein
MYVFFVSDKIYDKAFKLYSRKFATMVAQAISETEERLKIHILVCLDDPLNEPFFILDRRECDIVPDTYDYILSTGDFGV